MNLAGVDSLVDLGGCSSWSKSGTGVGEVVISPDAGSSVGPAPAQQMRQQLMLSVILRR